MCWRAKNSPEKWTSYRDGTAESHTGTTVNKALAPEALRSYCRRWRYIISVGCDADVDWLVINTRCAPLMRSYSLSGEQSTERYRVSIKRESHGVASAYIERSPV